MPATCGRYLGADLVSIFEFHNAHADCEILPPDLHRARSPPRYCDGICKQKSYSQLSTCRSKIDFHNSAPGRMMMQMVGAFAEFERAILRERTKTGLDGARKQGRIGGRRPKLRPNQQDEIVAMVSAGTKTAADAARLFNVHPATVSRLLARVGAGAIDVNV
jgi:hypothetical protein